MRILVGVQARSNSKRFPKKIFKELNGKPLLLWSYEAARDARYKIPEIEVRVLGTKDDSELKAFCDSQKIEALFPDCAENDLYARYELAAKEIGAQAVIRLTADCHLHPPPIIEDAARALLRGVDYISNTIHRTFLEGMDVQGASLRGLQWLSGREENHEHPFYDFDNNLKIREKFEQAGMKYEELINKAMAGLLLGGSIDTLEDLEVWNKRYQQMGASFQ